MEEGEQSEQRQPEDGDDDWKGERITGEVDR